MQPVPPLEFDGRRWALRAPPADEPIDTLEVTTLNVWFEPHERARRTRGLLDLLSDAALDVVCLQEVTPEVFALLLQAAFVREEMTVVSSLGTYGCVILSRLPVHSGSELELPSSMDRTLLVARIGGATIATSHLESTRVMRAARVHQLEAVFRSLEAEPDVVFCGDFNFDPSEPEEAAIAPTFHDVWTRCCRDEPGYTEDTTRNAMRRRAHGGRDKHVRYDRILTQAAWTPTAACLFADKPIADGVFVSDHFGVRASLRRSSSRA